MKRKKKLRQWRATVGHFPGQQAVLWLDTVEFGPSENIWDIYFDTVLLWEFLTHQLQCRQCVNHPELWPRVFTAFPHDKKKICTTFLRAAQQYFFLRVLPTTQKQQHKNMTKKKRKPVAFKGQRSKISETMLLVCILLKVKEKVF